MWLFDHGRIFYFGKFIYNLSMLRQSQRFPRETTQNHSSNFHTLVLRLKSKIQQLEAIIAQQQTVIDGFKHQYRNTKINQLQVQIQHLHQENKRLRQMAQQPKQRRKEPLVTAKKKTVNSCAKLTERKTVACQYRVEPKLYEVLKENETLRKQLVNLKINENVLKKRNSTLNDRSSIILQKSLIEHDHLLQEKIDLQAERDLLSKKVKQLQSKLAGLTTRNNELQIIHYKHIPSSMILADF